MTGKCQGLKEGRKGPCFNRLNYLEERMDAPPNVGLWSAV